MRARTLRTSRRHRADKVTVASFSGCFASRLASAPRRKSTSTHSCDEAPSSGPSWRRHSPLSFLSRVNTSHVSRAERTYRATGLGSRCARGFWRGLGQFRRKTERRASNLRIDGPGKRPAPSRCAVHELEAVSRFELGKNHAHGRGEPVFERRRVCVVCT